jgi:uncharacterized MAPEG superfamily protein
MLTERAVLAPRFDGRNYTEIYLAHTKYIVSLVWWYGSASALSCLMRSKPS